MRFYYTFIFIFFTILSVCAQPLFQYGTKTVSKDAFLRQFNRSLHTGENYQTAIKEYLPLFIKYKLKVQDAYDQRLDTLPGQLAEFADFRRQMEEKYFSEKAGLENLLNEAFSRSQQDIELQDILIAFDPKNQQSISTAAENAEKVIKQLASGIPFEKVLHTFCTDSVLRGSNGELGWITVFSLPYNMETTVYDLRIGDYCLPIQTTRAFHIFRKKAERKAQGKITVAQILFAYPPNVTATEKQLIQRKADSVYKALMQNPDFPAMARLYSDDITSYQKGGVLPEFGIGTYEISFEEAAFSLKRVGDISKPFESSSGVHILQLIKRTPVVQDKNDAQAMEYLRQHIVSDKRLETSKNKLIKEILPATGFKFSPSLDKKQLWIYTDSILRTPGYISKKIDSRTIIFRFTKQTVTIADWLKYIKPFYGKATGMNDDMFEQFIVKMATEYYKNHLEDFNADFKNQLQDFKEANLNFAITEKMVWSKAAQDSAGLSSYYLKNKARYQWDSSTNVLIVSGYDTALLHTIKNLLETDISSWKKIAVTYEKQITIDSSRIEQKQIPVDEKYQLESNTFTPVIINAQDNSQTFYYIINVINEKQQRNFEEARGFVMNDYQQELEKKWIQTLQKKYLVKIHEAVWKTLLKNTIN